MASGIDKASPVNMKLTDVAVGKALECILSDVGGVTTLGYRVDEGVVTISTRDDLDRVMVTKVYAIHDLVLEAKHFYGQGTTSGEAVVKLARAVCTTIAPWSWAPTGHATIEEANGNLIVTQTVEAHQVLSDFLAQLRATSKRASDQLLGMGRLENTSRKPPKSSIVRDYWPWAVFAGMQILGVILIIFGTATTETEISIGFLKVKTSSTGVVLCVLGAISLLLILKYKVRRGKSAADTDQSDEPR